MPEAMAPYLTQPPDPNPKTPTLKLPPGTIDCHVHIFGPSDRYAFDPASRYVSEDALPETNIRLQDTLNIARAVIVSGAGYGRTYGHLADVLERHGDRFRGVALLPEKITVPELARLDRLGVRGTRFVSTAHGRNLPGFSPEVAAMIAEFGWHVVFYPGRGELADFSQRLLDLPTPVVLDHFGCIDAALGIEQPAFKALLDLLDSGKVWVKISGPNRCSMEEPPYPSVVPMARKLVEHAPERLLWGTDWPHTNMNGRTMPNDGDLVDLLLDWVPDAATRQRILAENPAQLYR